MQKQEIFTGSIIEAYPNTLFKVKLDDGREIKAHLAGKMRLFRIKVLIGDRVELVLDPYGTLGRIVRRM
ncbi:MAG TPA: translation initiation factor IF-1 [Candidatus Paceibacterota bacterium]|nr:translation initiation factor IF-1 [Candidatus Paceibacterota bacterium]